MCRVLIADDSFTLRLLMRRVLLPKGHDVIEAPDGDRAWELLVEQRPDVAIVDIVMPGRSGLDICRRVRTDPGLASMGVIVISANLGGDEALAAGADAFLGKPFRPQELVAAVASVADARRAAVAHSG
jgi:CheY-like chemotaxis protein